MRKPEGKFRRRGLWSALAATSVAGTVALTLPMVASAQPAPEPTPTPTATATTAPPVPPTTTAPPPPTDPNAPPPAPTDPNAPPTDPNAPPAPPPVDPNRVNVPAGGFSYLLPGGWSAGDASRISYGQAVLLKTPAQGQPAATDTSILLGKLDLRLFAGAEQDNQKAAVRLASDMGEFYMPFPGTRVNQESGTFQAGDMAGASSFYEVKFTDASKPNGQIWAAAIGNSTPRTTTTAQQNTNRWFVVWLGTAANPVDKVAARALAESIRPYTPPPAAEPPPADPNAPPGASPAPGAPAAPGSGSQVGVPVPVDPNQAPGMIPPS
jgi:hypothetical protein